MGICVRETLLHDTTSQLPYGQETGRLLRRKKISVNGDHLDRISSLLLLEAIVDNGAIDESMRSRKVWQVACDAHHTQLCLQAAFQTSNVARLQPSAPGNGRYAEPFVKKKKKLIVPFQFTS